MTEKWADFAISAVEYSNNPKHIVRVAMRLDQGETLGNAAEMTRTAVINWIAAGYSVATVYRKDGKWFRGADVQIVVRDGTRYIRTDADRIKADNLGSLPGL